MDHMTILQLLLVSLPEGMLVAALGIILTGFRPSLKQLFIIGIFHALDSYIIRGSKIPFGLHTVLLLFVFMLLIYAVTRLNFITSALAGLSGLTITATVETLLAPQLLEISGYNYEDILTYPFLRIYFFLPEALFLFLIIILCRKYDISLLSYWRKQKQTGELTAFEQDIFLNSNFLVRQYIPLVVLVFAPILLVALLNVIFFAYQTGNFPAVYLRILTFIVSFAVLVLISLSAVAIKRIAKVVKIEYKAKQTAKTISQMEELIYSIRKQRHDFNHHLQAVYGLLEVGSYQEARAYIRNTFISITTHGELIKTDNHEISAMLFTKIGLAEAKNINLEILVNCSLKELPLKSREANSILGNLIDNAMDAVESVAGERRVITVEIIRDSKRFIFTVNNRGKLIKPEILDRIFEPHFSTKTGRQGLGLAIIKEIVEHYNGTVNVLSTNEETVFTVSIPSKR